MGSVDALHWQARFFLWVLGRKVAALLQGRLMMREDSLETSGFMSEFGN